MNNGILIATDEITRREWHTCSLLSNVHACMVKDASLLFSIAYDNEFLEQAGCANENAWKLGIKQTRLNLFSSDTRLETSNPTNGWIPRVKGTVRVHS